MKLQKVKTALEHKIKSHQHQNNRRKNGLKKVVLILKKLIRSQTLHLTHNAIRTGD